MNCKHFRVLSNLDEKSFEDFMVISNYKEFLEHFNSLTILNLSEFSSVFMIRFRKYDEMLENVSSYSTT